MVGTVTCANGLHYYYLPVCLSMTSVYIGLVSCIPSRVFLMMSVGRNSYQSLLSLTSGTIISGPLGTMVTAYLHAPTPVTTQSDFQKVLS